MTVLDPTGSAEVVNFAMPPLSWAVPRIEDPTEKVTGPVMTTDGEVILAVNVTA